MRWALFSVLKTKFFAKAAFDEGCFCFYSRFSLWSSLIFHKNLIRDLQLRLDNSPVLVYASVQRGGIMHEPTISFSIHEDKEKEIKQILTSVYDALRQKGYNPINQIVGYILSEDPTYITTHNNARSLIRRVDRDELLQLLVKSYLND